MIPKEGHWYMSDILPTVYEIVKVHIGACQINVWDKYRIGGVAVLHEVGYEHLIEIPKEVADILITRFY